MSAGVDQRAKGQPNQVSNGSTSKEGEFDPYMQSQQQQPPQGGYSSAAMSSPNVTDPYMSSYYAPYMSFPNQGTLSEGAWSNGDPMSFLGGYGQMNNEQAQQQAQQQYMSGNGMFGGFDYGQAGFGWGFPGGDYSAWGTTAATSQAQNQGQGRKDERGGYGDAYYNMGQGGMPESYSNMNGEMEQRDAGVKSVEQGLKGVSISEKQDIGGGGSGGGSIGTESSPGGHGGGHSGGHHGGQSTSGGPPPQQSSSQPKKMTWASVASQPARPQPKHQPKTIPRAPVLPGKHNMDIGTWGDSKNAANKGAQQARQAWNNGARGGSNSAGGPGRSSGVTPYSGPSSSGGPSGAGGSSGIAGSARGTAAVIDLSHPVLDKLRNANQYNPKEFNMNPKSARFFVIKSYSEDDIHRSIKYNIWCSTEHGNKRLDAAFREREGKGPIFLLYSVNGSGHFCGMSQMMSPVDYSSSSSVWTQDKWKGRFEVKWVYVKDVPNSQLRHIRLENNEDKPVTNSRDTQEVPPEKGKQIMRIIHQYRHTTSIFDDFGHYEKRQEEDEPPPAVNKPEKKDGGKDGGKDSGRDRDQGRDSGRDSGRDRDGGRDSGRDRDGGRDSGRDRDQGRDSGRDRDGGRDSGRDGGRDRDQGRDSGRDRDRGDQRPRNSGGRGGGQNHK